MSKRRLPVVMPKKRLQVNKIPLSQGERISTELDSNPARAAEPVAPVPLQTQLNTKILKLTELHNGLEILNQRMAGLKTDLITFMQANPSLKTPKYEVGSKYVRYIDRKNSDGLSQKLIIKGLTEYFQTTDAIGTASADIGVEVANALAVILAQRKSKIVPMIEITAVKGGGGGQSADDAD